MYGDKGGSYERFYAVCGIKNGKCGLLFLGQRDIKGTVRIYESEWNVYILAARGEW